MDSGAMAERKAPSVDAVKSKWTRNKPLFHLMVYLFLFYSGVLVTLPFLADLMINAFCNGEAQCSRVVLFMSVFTLACGIGAVFMGPFLGALSDDCGRKPILMLMTYIAIIPPALLVFSTSPTMTYVWFGVMIVVAIIRDGGLLPVSLAYVADVAGENSKSAAIGYVMAALSSGLACGTSAALLVKTNVQAFLLSAVLQAIAAVYMTIFVKESNPRKLPLPGSETRTPLLPRPVLIRQSSKLSESVHTIWNNRILRVVAAVDFLNQFASVTVQTFLLYWLKYRLDFGSDEFALLILIAAFVMAVGQGVYPLLSRLVGDRGVLWIGLVFGSGYYLWYGFGWSTWTAYLAAAHTFCLALITPASGTLVSRGAGKDEQGKVQGYMSGVRSIATILSPILMTPLTSGAMSENPPLGFPQLPFVICTAVSLLGFVISLSLPAPNKADEVLKKDPTVAVPIAIAPEDIVPVPHLAPELIRVVHPDEST